MRTQQAVRCHGVRSSLLDFLNMMDKNPLQRGQGDSGVRVGTQEYVQQICSGGHSIPSANFYQD